MYRRFHSTPHDYILVASTTRIRLCTFPNSQLRYVSSGQLESLPATQRAAWAAEIQSFQDTTGFYTLTPLENTSWYGATGIYLSGSVCISIVSVFPLYLSDSVCICLCLSSSYICLRLYLAVQLCLCLSLSLLIFSLRPSLFICPTRSVSVSVSLYLHSVSVSMYLYGSVCLCVCLFIFSHRLYLAVRLCLCLCPSFSLRSIIPSPIDAASMV